MFKSLLCLGGTLPNQDFFKTWSFLPTVATDGAGEKLVTLGVIPKTVVGDFDSLLKKDSRIEEWVHVLEQESTDFCKALRLIEARSLFPTLICGIGGGEIDHTFHNLEIFASWSQRYPMMFYDAQEGIPAKWGVCAQKEIQMFFEQTDHTVSLIPMPHAILTSEGLQWPLNADALGFLKRSGVRNKNKDRQVHIQVEAGMVLIIADGTSLISTSWDNHFLKIRSTP